MPLGDHGHRFNYWLDICQRCGTSRLQQAQMTPERAVLCSADENPDEAFANLEREQNFFERLTKYG